MEAALREKITVTFTRPEDDAPWRGTLTQDIIEDAWRKGLERPLETAKHEISRLVKMVRHERVSKPLVVVSGGTARNPAVKSRMKALCDESGVAILFTDDFAIRITNE
jgi:tRNA A37 threonylcarbamoyltransferase TsaD